MNQPRPAIQEFAIEINGKPCVHEPAKPSLMSPGERASRSPRSVTIRDSNQRVPAAFAWSKSKGNAACSPVVPGYARRT